MLQIQFLSVQKKEISYILTAILDAGAGAVLLRKDTLPTGCTRDK